MIHPLQLNYQVILGSQSPRRQSLLEGMNIPFEVKVLPVDESFDPGMVHEQVAVSLAEKKAAAFGTIVSDQKNILVITADTIVSVGTEILNKPTDRNEAIEMISKLNGNMHTVYTGVCILTAEGKESFVCDTRVYFNELSRHEIEYYIDTCKPYDKAGSYGVQEWIGYVGIQKIEGCFFNVMGLPVNELYKRLKAYTQKI